MNISQHVHFCKYFAKWGLICCLRYDIMIINMGNNKKRKNKQNQKFTQRRDNLVGVKSTPIPRGKRENQIKQLSIEMQHFDKSLKKAKHVARVKLGYNFDTDYMTDPSKTLGEIELKNDKHPQEFAIQMDTKLVQRFIDAPKFVLKKVDSHIVGERHSHDKTQYVCVAVLEEGPVIFEFYKHIKYPNGTYCEDNYNIGFFALLQGKDYFHINRYDSLSLKGHTRVFDDNGNIVMQFVSYANAKDQPHSHPYDIRFSVLFSGQRHIGHEDRHEEQKYADCETAMRAWMKKLHIVDLNKQISDCVTIGEIYDKLKQFQGNLSYEEICAKVKKMQEKEKFQNNFGGEKWNSSSSQSKSKTQSKQKN